VPTADREHLAYQRRYYARPERVRSRMAPVRSRYVLRHLERLLDRLDLAPGARVVELGAGMGRFSLLPPALGNRPAFARLEEGVERLRFLEPILAFQIVSGTCRGA